MEQQKLKSAQTVVGSKSADKRKRKVTVGSIWESKSFGEFKVIEYKNCEMVRVKFLNTGFETCSTSQKIRMGHVKDRLARSVFGVGFLGLNAEKIKPTSKGLNPYQVWFNMMRRCYSEKTQLDHPTYIGCTVCEEWHNYQNFAEWYCENYPRGESKCHIDKDLKVIGSKIYSPETCMIVPASLNSFLTDSRASRGDFLIGASFEASVNKFKSYCNNPFTRKLESLGRFDKEIDAHLAWRKRKSELAYELAMAQDRKEVKVALLNWKAALDNFEIHKVDITHGNQ